jgi:uncharacterized membrane protein YbaN (DUF454 family)
MRPIYAAIGFLFVVLAALGAVLPIVPTVPFLLVAVFCFARSNPAWEQKILDHPHWGSQVKDWRDRKAINRKAKYIAIMTLLVGTGFTWVTLGSPWVYLSISILIVCGSWIWTRNE